MQYPAGTSELRLHCPHCGAVIPDEPHLPDDPEFDNERHTIKGFRISPNEWIILSLLRLHYDRLVTNDNIIQSMYGESRDEPDSALECVKIYIHRLRKAFRRQHVVGWEIDTVWGEGFILSKLFDDPVVLHH